MKIDKETESLIIDAAYAASSVGIDSIAIDEHGIRGTSDTNQIVMLKPSFDLEVPFESIGIGDVKEFVQRHKLNSENDNSCMELEDKKDDGHITNVVFKSNKLKIDYRCFRADRIKPIKFKDVEYASFTLTDDDITMIKKGSVIMRSDTILLYKDVKMSEVAFKFMDINKSEFKYETESYVQSDDDDCSFATRYPVKLLLAALKDADSYTMILGEKESLTIVKNQIELIIAPTVE